MGISSELILQTIGVSLFVAGALVVMFAKTTVKYWKLDDNVKCDFEHEMTKLEMLEYKNTKAVVNTKMIGMLVALPGLVIILYAFR